jgi:hypothetical protein
LIDKILDVVVVVILLPALYVWIRGNPETALLLAILALVALDVSLSCLSLRKTRSSKEITEMPKQSPRGVLVHDVGNDKQYLVDHNELFREIPDNDTFCYLRDVLGITGDLPTVTASEVAARLGKEIPAVREYKRPLTPEEQRLEQLEWQVRAMLPEEIFYAYNRDPQVVIVQFTNTGDDALYLRRAEFMPTSDIFMLRHFRRTEKPGVFSCLDEGKNLSPGQKYPIEFPLTATWAEGSLERLKEKIGFLTIWIQFEGEEVKLLFHI